MSKSIKYKNDVYLSTEGIVHGTEPLIESGTWEPELSCVNEDAPTVTYTKQLGEYIKIGKLVYITFAVRGRITALNGTNNYALIAGVPYIEKQKFFSTGAFSMTIGQIYNAVATETNQTMYVYENGIRLQHANGQVANSWQITTASSGFRIEGSGYFIVK